MEIWKDVINYEGLYLVSNHGNVKSIDRTVKRNGNDLKLKGCSRKLCVHKNGYIRIPLSKNGIVKYFYVHNLVALAFIGEKPKRHDVDHKDSNRKNNNILNLHYLTFKKNRGIIGNDNALKTKKS